MDAEIEALVGQIGTLALPAAGGLGPAIEEQLQRMTDDELETLRLVDDTGEASP